jgi:hypothetical protein
MTSSDLEARVRRLELGVRRRDALVAALVLAIIVFACHHEDTPAAPTSLEIGAVSSNRYGITIKDSNSTLGLYADRLSIDNGRYQARLSSEDLTIVNGGSQSSLHAGPPMLLLRSSEHDQLSIMADANQASIFGKVAHGENFGILASGVDEVAEVVVATHQKQASIYAKGGDASTKFDAVK